MAHSPDLRLEPAMGAVGDGRERIELQHEHPKRKSIIIAASALMITDIKMDVYAPSVLFDRII